MLLKALKKLASILSRTSSDYANRADYDCNYDGKYDYDRYDFGDEKDIREARRLFKELNNNND